MTWLARPVASSTRSLRRNPTLRVFSLILWCCVLSLSGAQASLRTSNVSRLEAPQDSLGREVAARFAPIFYQALGENPRSDSIPNVDFDGDWRGDNNWENCADEKFPLLAYVYYSVSETQTHYFLHYAVFHPRDYKGGERKGLILSELIREGIKRGGKYDPTGLADEAGVAHENDLEGALIVVAKNGSGGDGNVVFVETLHHSNFSPYRPGEVAQPGFGLFRTNNNRVEFYVEPKGHGVETYDGDDKQTSGKAFKIYKFAGKAEDPEKSDELTVGYELVPIRTTLWTAVKTKPANNKTYGSFHDYGELALSIAQANGRVAVRKIKIGTIGMAFLGNTGAPNMARPPWGWFDKNRREDPLGLWFFDPAKIIKRDFGLDDSFSTIYVRLPFWAEK